MYLRVKKNKTIKVPTYDFVENYFKYIWISIEYIYNKNVSVHQVYKYICKPYVDSLHFYKMRICGDGELYTNGKIFF